MPTTLTQRAPGHPTGPAPDRRNPKVVLAIILATYLMIILDATIVITALPDIHRALGLLVDRALLGAERLHPDLRRAPAPRGPGR